MQNDQTEQVPKPLSKEDLRSSSSKDLKVPTQPLKKAKDISSASSSRASLSAKSSPKPSPSSSTTNVKVTPSSPIGKDEVGPNSEEKQKEEKEEDMEDLVEKELRETFGDEMTKHEAPNKSEDKDMVEEVC